MNARLNDNAHAVHCGHDRVVEVLFTGNWNDARDLLTCADRIIDSASAVAVAVATALQSDGEGHVHKGSTFAAMHATEALYGVTTLLMLAQGAIAAAGRNGGGE
jgi:hypothetical protein